MIKINFLKYPLLAIPLLLLGIRGYGCYVDDQSELLIYAQTFVDSGKLSCNPTDHTMFGNTHPPSLPVLLAFFIKFTNIFFAPVLVQLLCCIVTLFLLFKIQGTGGASTGHFRRRFSLLFLFFLLPFTHQSFLFIDIDNTLLPAWGALFILGALSNKKNGLRYSVFMGLVFAIGLWCKLTTPIIVFIIWSILLLIANFSLFTVSRILSAAAIAVSFFLITYIPFCNFADVPAGYPFAITFGKGTSQASGLLNISDRLGTMLRSIYLDIHWFSVILFFIAGYKTAIDIKKFTWKREDLKRLYPAIYFWCIYLCYTIVVPTMWLPRYKFALLPFVVWWLQEDFYLFVNSVRPSTLIMLLFCGIGLSMALPDFGTSGLNYQLYFHSHTLLKTLLQGIPYYPHGFTETMGHLAVWSKASIIRSPVGLFCFVFYFMTWMGFALILLNGIAAYLIYLSNKNILRSFFILAIVLWTCQFAQNMRRDYALFYCAGTRGFEKIIPVLKDRLKSGEPFIGNKEFSAYTGNPFCFLNQWGDREQEIDTTRLHGLLASRQIRYLVYLNRGEAVEGLDFKQYLQRNFSLDCQKDDYFLWKKNQ